MDQELAKELNKIDRKLESLGNDLKQIKTGNGGAATVGASTFPLSESTKPPVDIEKRLQKLEKKSETIVLAFPNAGPPMIVPENILAKRNDKVTWQVVHDASVNLQMVRIQFADGTNYFSGNTSNVEEITIGTGPNIISGKVKGDHLTGIDKYSIHWQIDGTPDSVDPTIIVTDP